MANLGDSAVDGTRYSVVWEPLPEPPLQGGLVALFSNIAELLNGDCGKTVNCITFPMWGTPRGPALPMGSLATRSVSGLDDLAAFRSQLGLATGEGALARLDIGGQSFYGINAHGQQINLRVNAITRTHAEADAFQQAANASMRAGSATLYVDRASGLCPACGKNGGVVGLARQLGISELTIVTPQGIQIVRIGL